MLVGAVAVKAVFREDGTYLAAEVRNSLCHYSAWPANKKGCRHTHSRLFFMFWGCCTQGWTCGQLVGSLIWSMEELNLSITGNRIPGVCVESHERVASWIELVPAPAAVGGANGGGPVLFCYCSGGNPWKIDLYSNQAFHLAVSRFFPEADWSGRNHSETA